MPVVYVCFELADLVQIQRKDCNMIDNNLCLMCEKYNVEKYNVCKIVDILQKFSEDAKKPLGVDIDIQRCSNFAEDKVNDE